MAQQQPHNLDMERYVLGSIMINKQKEVCKITEEDFYNNLHKRIYTIMNDLFTNNKNIDEITVADALSNHTIDAYEVTTRISDAARIGGRFDNALETLKTYTLRRSIIEKAYSLNSLRRHYGA
jgi:replicative DNA helicase